jgi:hypothetical protein
MMPDKDSRRRQAENEIEKDVCYFWKYYPYPTINLTDIIVFLKYEDSRLQSFVHRMIPFKDSHGERNNMKKTLRHVLNVKTYNFFTRKNITIQNNITEAKMSSLNKFIRVLNTRDFFNHSENGS